MKNFFTFKKLSEKEKELLKKLKKMGFKKIPSSSSEILREKRVVFVYPDGYEEATKLLLKFWGKKGRIRLPSSASKSGEVIKHFYNCYVVDAINDGLYEQILEKAEKSIEICSYCEASQFNGEISRFYKEADITVISLIFSKRKSEIIIE